MKKGTNADKWPCEVQVSLSTENEEIVNMLGRALKPLEKELRFHRGSASIYVDGCRLVINGYARDITSLRSVLNGLLKCLYLSYMVIVENLRVNK